MVGDASAVPIEIPPFTAIFTCFALQQLPNPKKALSTWTQALVPGGVLVACFWPTIMEVEGPWRRMVEILPPPRRNVREKIIFLSQVISPYEFNIIYANNSPY